MQICWCKCLVLLLCWYHLWHWKPLQLLYHMNKTQHVKLSLLLLSYHAEFHFHFHFLISLFSFCFSLKVQNANILNQTNISIFNILLHRNCNNIYCKQLSHLKIVIRIHMYVYWMFCKHYNFNLSICNIVIWDAELRESLDSLNFEALSFTVLKDALIFKKAIPKCDNMAISMSLCRIVQAS